MARYISSSGDDGSSDSDSNECDTTTDDEENFENDTSETAVVELETLSDVGNTEPDSLVAKRKYRKTNNVQIEIVNTRTSKFS